MNSSTDMNSSESSKQFDYMSPDRGNQNTMMNNTTNSKKPGNPFVYKLELMLSNPEYGRLIHWSASGASFIIVDPSEFSQALLPQYYKHNKLSSFIRQLNMYGFHKKIRAPRGTKNNTYQSLEFYHSKFLKDNFHLRKHIRRLSTVKSDALAPISETNFIKGVETCRNQSNEVLSRLKHLEEDMFQVKTELEEANKALVNQERTINQLTSFNRINNTQNHNSGFNSSQFTDQSSNCLQPTIFITPPCDTTQNPQSRVQQNSDPNNLYSKPSPNLTGNVINDFPNNNNTLNSPLDMFNNIQISQNQLTSSLPNTPETSQHLTISTMNLQSNTYLYPGTVSPQCSEASYSDDESIRISPVSPVNSLLYQTFGNYQPLPNTSSGFNNQYSFYMLPQN